MHRASFLPLPLLLATVLLVLLAVHLPDAVTTAYDGLQALAHEWARQATALTAKPV